VFVDVVLRYAFNNSSIALQELEWHLFSAMFLLSIAYGLQNDTGLISMAFLKAPIAFSNLPDLA
jgi:TRAP-type mannitol/chloroaromatic compound transport system permease small subunit